MAKTKPNSKGQTFDVTFNKEFKIEESGLRFKLIPRDHQAVKMLTNDPQVGFFYKPMLQVHQLNVGCCIFVYNEGEDKNEIPLYPTDNEFDLSAIYTMIEQGQCI